MRSSLVCTCIVIAVAADTSGAQNFNQKEVYASLMRTTISGLPPLATSTILDDVQAGLSGSIRYGYLTPGMGVAQIQNIAATFSMPIGVARSISLTGGLSSESALGEVVRSPMFSIAGDSRLMAMTLGRGPGASRIDLAVSGEVGVGLPHFEPGMGDIVSGQLGFPLSWTPRGVSNDAIRFVPFVTPAVGFASLTCARCRAPVPGASGGAESENGATFVLGGGLGIYNRASTVAFSIGVHYIGLPKAQPQIGAALTLIGR
jgi:hypothetical protein